MLLIAKKDRHRGGAIACYARYSLALRLAVAAGSSTGHVENVVLGD